MKGFLVVFVTLLSVATTSFGAFPISHPNCANPQVADFDITGLFSHTNRNDATLKHPGVHSLIRFDLLRNGDDVDVFFGGFEGILYRYNSQTKAITTIKNFQTIQGSVGNAYNGGDHGVTGIAFHPNFENNRWVFIFYTPKVASNQNRVMRLSRFEMTPQYQLQNEKILLSMEATTTDKWHSGGDMYFTAQGDLFLQVGDNVGNDGGTSSKAGNAAWTSGSTENLIGGVVRIHPDSSTTGYSIPKGNFGEHFAPIMQDIDYLNPVKVKPEIFAKGQRSNFTATGHPTELIHIWGEVNSGGSHDEINVVNEPVYGGWPHFQGNASSNRTGGSGNRYSHNINDYPELNSSTVNMSWVPNAVTRLPKVYPSDFVAGGTYNLAMAHAFYYYGKSDSIWAGRTFPPNFHETFMFHGHKKTNPRIVPISKTASGPTFNQQNSSYDVKNLFTNNGSKLVSAFHTMIEAKYGPDGALYVLSRGGASQQYGKINSLMSRIDYKGSCQDQALFNFNRKAYEDSAKAGSNYARYRIGYVDSSLYNDGTNGASSLVYPSGRVELQAGEALDVQVLNLQGQVVGMYTTAVTSAGKVEAWNGLLNGKTVQQGVYFLQYRDLSGNLLFHQKQALSH